MSQENVEIVRRHHQAFINGDREGALEPLDPEIEFVFHLSSIPSAHGHAEFEKAMARWLGTWVETALKEGVDALPGIGVGSLPVQGHIRRC
ncbi:MAG: hypothetical protein AABM43_03150 [Actinomycetota bacterium]